jgi:hypothetical protein
VSTLSGTTATGPATFGLRLLETECPAVLLAAILRGYKVTDCRGRLEVQIHLRGVFTAPQRKRVLNVMSVMQVRTVRYHELAFPIYHGRLYHRLRHFRLTATTDGYVGRVGGAGELGIQAYKRRTSHGVGSILNGR